MKLILLLALLLLNCFAWANDTILLPKVTVEIETENAMAKVEAAVNNPEGILRRYQPAGFVVKNKVVNGNTIEFTGTKKILMISRTAHFKGVLDIQESVPAQKENQTCYDAQMDLSASDDLITDNISDLSIKICITENASNSITTEARPRLTKGNHYHPIFGPIVKEMVIAQINPVIKAVKEEIIQ